MRVPVGKDDHVARLESRALSADHRIVVGSLSETDRTHEFCVLDLATESVVVDLMVRTRLAESKGAAHKLIDGGGVYLNHERQTQARRMIRPDDEKWPAAILLRTGKKSYHLVRIK